VVLVRLAGGMSSSEGNLQVLHKGVWGAVCTDAFTDAEAEIVCSTLGFGYSVHSIYTAFIKNY